MPVHQTSSCNIPSELSSPKDISSCHITKLTNILRKASSCKYVKDKSIALNEAASNSIWNSSLSLSFELQQIIRLVQSVQKEIDALILK